jgi:cAMP phosphodiesterase
MIFFHICNIFSGTPSDKRPTAKSLIGLSTTLTTIKDSVFNNKLWPNIPLFTNRYTYQTVQPLQGYSVNQLLAFPTGSPYNDAFKDVSVKVFDICHSDVTSTAYLFTAASNSTEKQILYLSDTGTATSTGNNTCSWRAKLNTIWSDRALNVKQLTYDLLLFVLTLIVQFSLKYRQVMVHQMHKCLVI